MSLAKYPFGAGQTETIVVDNASADDSAEMVRTEFPDVRLIANTTNQNYAAGTNQALTAATGDFLLLLNPDVEFTAGALDALVTCLVTHAEDGAVAAKLVYPDGRTQASVRGFPEPWPLLYDIVGLARLFPRSQRFAAYRQTFFDYEADGPAPQPMASCFLISRTALKKVGSMDERFPLYFNDVDWCLRCWDVGLGIRYCAEAVVIHKHGGTTRRVRKAAVWESHRALLRLYEKHYRGGAGGQVRRTPAPLYAFLTALITLGAWLRTGRWGKQLGRDGGETTPESLHRELEREGVPPDLPSRPEGSGPEPGDHQNRGGG